jgi:hypothetical protein
LGADGNVLWLTIETVNHLPFILKGIINSFVRVSDIYISAMNGFSATQQK